MRHSSFYQPGGMLFEAVKREEAKSAKGKDAPASDSPRPSYAVKTADGRKSAGFENMTGATLCGIESGLPFDQWEVVIEEEDV
jgi:hypothetical protein